MILFPDQEIVLEEARQKLTAELVRELLDYDPSSGILTWKERQLRHFKKEWDCAAWNKKFANKKAGTINSEGYLVLTIFDRQFRSSRIIWLWVTGKLPEGLVDHKNGNRCDNVWINLRDCSILGNRLNSRKSPANSSGFKGVSWDKKGEKWRSVIRANGIRLWLGYYDTPEEAYAVYCKAATKYHKEFANDGLGPIL